jgi:hypothetical protein
VTVRNLEFAVAPDPDDPGVVMSSLALAGGAPGS